MDLRRLLPSMLAVLAALALAVGPGCASDDDETKPPAPKADLPPDGTKPIAAIYDARLAPLGWKVQRASLEERDQPQPKPPGKRHLAVYLRPTGQPTTKDYLDGLATVSKVFLPQVFEQYPGLQSFDVCLEPTEAQDPSAYPKALTQVHVNRPQAGAVDWRTADAAEVVAAGIVRHPNTLVLLVSPTLRATSEWQELQAAANARV